MSSTLKVVKTIVKHQYTVAIAKNLVGTAVSTFGMLAGFAAFGAVTNRLARVFKTRKNKTTVNPE